jgi:hypothetical protein
VRCIICKRDPVAGETYGSHADGWDFTGICPECWDKSMGDAPDYDGGGPGDEL